MSRARDTADWGQFKPVRKNLLMNGNFRVLQRGTSFPAYTGSYYAADRWRLTMVSDGDFTSSIGAKDTESSFVIDITTADATIGVSQYGIFYQPIEGHNISQLLWGTSGAKTLTLSFEHAHTKTGTYCISIRSSNLDRSYVAEYTQAVADTWERSTITIPGPTDGTWGTDETVGMYVSFAWASGSTYHATADTWQVGNKIATSNQVNAFDSTSNFIRVASVQLEVGNEATDFEYRSFAEELAMCQRYFEKSYNEDVDPGTITTAGQTTFRGTGSHTATYGKGERFAVTKRSNPTMTMYSPTTGASGNIRNTTPAVNADLSVTGISGIGDTGYGYVTCPTGWLVNHKLTWHWTADAEL